MNRIIDEILEDIQKPSYVPDQADALFLIAFYLKELASKAEDR